MTQPRMVLLGPPRWLAGAREVSFRADKRYQLLAYLAHRREWVRRDEAAYLFWPDVPNARARHSLRQLWRRVRALAWLEGVESDRQRLCWRVEHDVASFERALADGDHEQALQLGRRSFLEGLEGSGEGEFARWLAFEREHLHGAWRRALLERVEALRARGETRRALDWLELLLERDPFDEEAVRLLLRGAGRRAGSAAERERGRTAYRAFAARLERDLGLAPSSETERLAAELLAGASGAAVADAASDAPAAVGAGAAGPPALPEPLTSFVGRDLELGELSHRLLQSECRLLTLVGPGGIGKSRIALRAVRELAPRYRDGVAFVPLETVASADGVATTIATALKLPLAGEEAPLEQLVRALRERELLLVLDGFEHLVAEAASLSALLRACAGIDLLVTSRERLALEEEWLLRVEGLAFPQRAPDPESAAGFDAVRLFIERARQVRPGFSLDDAADPVVAVCRLLAGSPLGLELAAVWVRVLPAAEIAAEIARDLDFLEAEKPTERHRSLRATFEHSWRLLADAEQRVLRRLAVFRGGFTREAAGVVTGASVALLAALVDKSLLRVTAAGRYDRHPTVYRYTREKLAEREDERERFEAAHARTYLQLLQRQRARLVGESHRDALEVVEAELDNLAAAWSWCLRAGDAALAASALEPLAQFYDDLGRYHEGAELLARVETAFPDDDPPALRARGYAAIYRANLIGRSGRFVDAAALAHRGSAHLKRAGDRYGAMLGRFRLGTFLAQQGDAGQALPHLEAALEGARAFGDEELLVAILGNLGLVSRVAGDMARAERYLTETYQRSRRLGKNFNVVLALIHLADIASEHHGDPEGARARLEEAREIAVASGLRNVMPDLLRSLAAAHHALGDAGAAVAAARDGATLAREMGDLTRLARLEAILGTALAALGRTDEALERFCEGLRAARASQDREATLLCLLAYAAAIARAGEAARGVELSARVLALAGENRSLAARAEAQLAALEPLLPTAEFAAARGRGSAGNSAALEEVVDGILARG